MGPRSRKTTFSSLFLHIKQWKIAFIASNRKKEPKNARGCVTRRVNAPRLNRVICEACAPATPVNEQTVSSGSRGAAGASRPRVNID